jgi:hypothetical protein
VPLARGHSSTCLQASRPWRWQAHSALQAALQVSSAVQIALDFMLVIILCSKKGEGFWRQVF